MRNLSKVLIVLLVPAIVFGMASVAVGNDIVETGTPEADDGPSGDIEIELTAQERAVLLISEDTLDADILDGVIDFGEEGELASTGVQVNANTGVNLEISTGDDGFDEDFLNDWVSYELYDTDGGDVKATIENPDEDESATWSDFLSDPGSNDDAELRVWIEIPEEDTENEWWDLEANETGTDTVTLTVTDN